MTQQIKWLQDELADRMLQKLDIVKLNVRDILVAPGMTGKPLSSLVRRYPSAQIFNCIGECESRFRFWFDMARSSLHSALRGKTSPITSFISSGKFDLPDNSVDLVFSNLLLQDLADPRLFLKECWRVLRDGGLITFSYLGPDTGKELHGIVGGDLRLVNLASPWDMHDVGDALLEERFSDPVMDMEFIHLEYESHKLIIEDAQALKLLQKIDSANYENAVFPEKMTLEVVYGHAWVVGKHLSKSQNNVAYIDLNQIGHKTRRDSA